MADDFRRTSGQCICPTCKKPYWQHPHETRDEFLGHDGKPFLRVLCSGDRVKL